MIGEVRTSPLEFNLIIYCLKQNMETNTSTQCYDLPSTLNLNCTEEKFFVLRFF